MGKLCYSLCQMDVEYCLAWALADIGPHAVELRLDDLIFDLDDLRYFMENRGDCSVVATYRMKDPSEVDTLDLGEDDDDPEPSDVDMAVRMLSTAIIAGADYIDIDMDFPRSSLSWLVHLALNYGCKVILSHHNAFGTDSTDDLAAVVQKGYSLGADIVKVVTTAHHPSECARVLALYDRFPPEQLIAFAMGREGEQSRYDSFYKGAPLMYVAPRRRLPTASGQPLFFDFLGDDDTHCWGDVMPPCAKSMAVRAIVAAALASGETTLENITLCGDILAAMSVAEQMLATVNYNSRSKELSIVGRQNIKASGLRLRDNILDVGECGLLCRICVPLVSLCRKPVLIIGSGALQHRRFATSCPELTKHGLSIDFMKEGGGVPIFVSGSLKGGVYSIASAASAQFVSGLIMALPLLDDGDMVLKIRELSCLQHVRMTLDIASRLGVKYDEDVSADGKLVTLRCSSSQPGYRPSRIEIENDWSIAALWLTLGVVAGESGVDHMRINSHQAESFILDVFDIAGADIERFTDPEMEFLDDNVGYHSAFRSLTVAFECDISSCPDLLGPLILLALRSEGTSRIYGLKALRDKGHGLAAKFVSEFSRLGAELHIEKDCMVVTGSFDNRLKATLVHSWDNHHLALALMAAGAICDGELEIDDISCIDRIWPDFPLR